MTTAVLLFVFNRPEHTGLVLESLRRQSVHLDADIIVYVDKPYYSKDIELNKNVLKVLDSWSDSFNLNIIKRKSNYGIKLNITDGVSECLKDYDSVIVIEDDIVLHPQFMEFMIGSLYKYQYDNSINTICGYQYPNINLPNSKLYGALFHRFNPWGWATWKNKWSFQSISFLNELIQSMNIKLPNDLYSYINDEKFKSGNVDIWSLNVVLKQFIENKWSIFPNKSLITNIGFDGTGVHSTDTDAFNSNINFKNLDIDINTLIRSEELENLINEFASEHLKKVMYKR